MESMAYLTFSLLLKKDQYHKYQPIDTESKIAEEDGRNGVRGGKGQYLKKFYSGQDKEILCFLVK